ncbi:MAG: lysozyme inhibitor LprI family protein [Elainellaceae cyanobacterium]
MWRRWLLVLLIAGVGCAGPKVDSPAPSSTPEVAAEDAVATADETIITGDRIGPVRVGTTLGELETVVKQTYGEEVTFVPTPNFMVDLDAIAVNLGEETLFYALYFGSESLSDSEPVELLLTTNPRFKTPKGVGPGTTLQAAEAAYGEATLAHSTENEMRESVRFANFNAASVVFRTNGFSEAGPGLAGIYDESAGGSFFETTQYRDDAVIRAVMVDGNRLEAARSPLGDEPQRDETDRDETEGDEYDPPQPGASDGGQSYAQADRQLNQTYGTVMNTLAPDAQTKLVDAQQAWISFRDAECGFQPLVGLPKEACLAEMSRDRTAQLDQKLTDDAPVVPDWLLTGLGSVTVEGSQTVNCDDPQGTPEINYCIGLGYEREDDRLNQVYQAIQDGPTTAAKDSLVDAQLAWIDFRDAHCLSEVHNAYGATGYNAYYAACQARLTQQRTTTLSGYGDLL